MTPTELIVWSAFLFAFESYFPKTKISFPLKKGLSRQFLGVCHLMLNREFRTRSFAMLTLVATIGAGIHWQSRRALASAPPTVVQKSEGKKSDEKPASKLQGRWKDLASPDDVKVTKAVLELAATPKETMALLQAELRPVKFDRTKALKWIADLGSDKEEVYRPAMKELDYIAPLILDDLNDAIENAPNENARQRALKIMMDVPEELAGAANPVVGGIAIGGAVPAPAVPIPVPPPVPGGGAAVIQIAGGPGMDEGVFRWSWKRAVRAITILEHIGTPEAIAAIKKIADGEIDAAPTKAAKAALKRMENQEDK
jgi:hypothetical protein